MIPEVPRANLRDSCVRALPVVVVALLVLLFRRPDAFLNPQFWAEDFVFLIGAEKAGFATLWMPQAGYLQVIPRLFAWLGDGA